MDTITLLKNLEKPTCKVDVVLDTDAYNEIDDQFALSYLLSYKEKLCTKAIYAAPFFNKHSNNPEDGMEKSYKEILHLLHLIKRKDLISLTYKGASEFLPNEQTPVDSPAARHLCSLSMNYDSEHPLYVIAIGAITNVASAILMQPEIIERIVIIWLGGHALHWPHSSDFNMFQDMAAARIVFERQVPHVMFPCQGVVSAFTISKAELLYWLKGKNPLCDYLVQRTIDEVTYAEEMPWTRPIWDVTAVAWLTGDFEDSIIIPSPIPEYDHHYAIDVSRHPMRYVFHIKRDALVADLFARLSTL